VEELFWRKLWTCRQTEYWKKKRDRYERNNRISKSWSQIIITIIIIISFEGGSSRSHYVEELFWRKLWTCRQTEYWMMISNTYKTNNRILKSLSHIIIIISFEGGSSRSHYVEESFWRRLWNCRQEEYRMNIYIYIYIYMSCYYKIIKVMCHKK
jgi:hypothetical protein